MFRYQDLFNALQRMTSEELSKEVQVGLPTGIIAGKSLTVCTDVSVLEDIDGDPVTIIETSPNIS